MSLLKNKKRKGFTLVELIVVVIIIGVLLAVGITRFQDASDNAKVQAFRSNHQILVSAINMYAAAHSGDLPKTDADFDAYVTINQSADHTGTTLGIAALQGKPATSTYTWTPGTGTAKGKLTSALTAPKTLTLTYEP